MNMDEHLAQLRGTTAMIVCALFPISSAAAADPASAIASVFNALAATSLKATPQAEPAEYPAAVSARKSLDSPEHIISMIDGKPYKTLKRHLATHGLTPDEYRDRYGLPASYPMVAPAYSETRSALAKKSGLGRRPDPRAPTAG